MKYFLSLLTFLLITSCNSQKNMNNYTTIEYEAGACFGFCPIYKMTINSDRNAILDAERFNFTTGNSKDDFSKPREGTFKAVIKEADYKKLVKLLKEINPKELKSKYGNHNITDLPTSYLRLKFVDGSKNEIEDYGKHGTDKLVELYKFFEDLKHNQEWKKVD